MTYDIEEIKKHLYKKLKYKRYNHSLGVMYTAQALAMRYNFPIYSAGVAGILHDCAKEMTNDELLKFCLENDIIMSDDEQICQYLLHSKVGAYIAKHKYKIKDTDVIDSIRFHTTGHPNMSLREKIIFVADYIEPNRYPIDQLDIIRYTAFQDIDMACAMILQNTLKHLKKDPNRHIDVNTIEAYDYYRTLLE